ncbi:MAG: chain-length determining protein [Rhodobacteraceae bacterium]|nr:chain-length determining protein [Paracoccaceae bacterium]
MAHTGSRGQNSQHDDEGLDLLHLLTTLWQGKWLIAACIVLATLIGGYYAFQVAVPRYAATSNLALQMRSQLVREVDSAVAAIPPDFSAMYTELEVITSRRIMEQVVRKLDLTKDPEFNPALREIPAFSMAGIKRSIRGLFGINLPNAPENFDVDSPATFNTTVSSVRGSVFAEAKRYTYIFEITALSRDPVKAGLIANAVAETYIENQIAVKYEAIEQAIDWLSERVAALEADLKEKEDAIKQIHSQTDLINAQTLEALNRQAKENRDRLQETLQSAAAARAELARLEQLREGGDIQTLSDALNDPTLKRLLKETEVGTENARRLFDARAELLLSRVRTGAERFETQAKALQTAVERLNGQIAEQAEDLAKLVQLEREAEATSVLYETFLSRLKETTVQRGLQQADVRVISEAGRGKYVEPRKSMILAISMVLGAVLGTLVILLRQFLYSGFRTADDLSKHTGLAVLGQIPRFPIKSRSELLPYLVDKPTSAAAEAVRNLRTSILLSDLDNPPQVIMSTSSVPAEGKTTQAIALAHNLSGLGKKVLLIEGDIRRRTFTKYFDKVVDYGVLSVLSGSVPLKDAVVRDSLLNADVLMGEKTNVNAADVFSSEAFHHFLEQARAEYDSIIIDTPPVLVVPDARVIAQSVDAVVFSVAWDSTTKAQVVEGLQQFELVNQKVAGLVLSQIDPSKMKRYGYGGKYGAHANYGASYYEL